jgi:hypothetical protein
MNINFFDPKCQTTTSEAEFGICDDPPPPHQPAYISTTDPDKWIATIQNSNELELVFTAIDNCIEIKRDDGNMESRCDAMIICGNNIIFVELKERNSGKWQQKGEKQLKTIIDIFGKNHGLDSYGSKVAYVANKFKPDLESSQKERIQKFKDQTGFTLRILNKIVVS